MQSSEKNSYPNKGCWNIRHTDGKKVKVDSTSHHNENEFEMDCTSECKIKMVKLLRHNREYLIPGRRKNTETGL